MSYRIAYDPQSCIHCYTCMVQCSVENTARIERDSGSGSEKTHNMALLYLSYLLPVHGEYGTSPEAKRLTEFHHCQHCEKAPCAQACPTHTIAVRPNGLVVIREEGCNGCQACVEACPWDVPKFDPETHKVWKCVGCWDRVEAGMEPACVAACPSVALFAGDGEVVIAEAEKRAEHYSQVHGKKFIAYGARSVSSQVGKSGWITVAPMEDAEAYGLPEKLCAAGVKPEDTATKVTGIGLVGLAGAVGSHLLNWLGKRRNEVPTTERDASG